MKKTMVIAAAAVAAVVMAASTFVLARAAVLESKSAGDSKSAAPSKSPDQSKSPVPSKTPVPSKAPSGPSVRLEALSVEDPKGTGRLYDRQTSLKFRVSQAGKRFVGVDHQATKIIYFQDDRNSDMSPRSYVTFVAPASERAGEPVSVNLVTPHVPAAGAREVRVRADVVLLACTSQKYVRAPLDLKVGTEAAVGPVPVTVKSARNVSMGEAKTLVTLVSSTQGRPGQINLCDERITHIAFYNSAGKKIEHSVYRSSSGGTAAKRYCVITFALAERATQVTMALTYRDKTQKITVPVETTARVGL